MNRAEKIEFLRERKSPWISSGFRTVRQFRSLDPDQPHCYSKTELCAKFSVLTGLPPKQAEKYLHHLFALQPSMTYGKFGALTKEKTLSGIPGIISLSPESIDKIFPPEWYITLQLPEKNIRHMVWSCHRYGRFFPQEWSPALSEQVLLLLKRRRGEFLRNYPAEELKFFWMEYGSMFIQLNRKEA